MLVYLEHRELLRLPRREQQRIQLVRVQYTRHLVVPTAHVRADEVEDALERRNEHPRNIVRSVKPLLAVVEDDFWSHSTVDETCVGRASDNDVGYAVSILNLVVGVFQHSASSNRNARWWRRIVTVNPQELLTTPIS